MAGFFWKSRSGLYFDGLRSEHLVVPYNKIGEIVFNYIVAVSHGAHVPNWWDTSSVLLHYVVSLRLQRHFWHMSHI